MPARNANSVCYNPSRQTTRVQGVSLPLSQLSHLDLLRGFVAVGRRMSITLAAQDLHLTQSAVSRQVLALEERVGTSLLVRGHRAISLTPAGEKLFAVADAAIGQLQGVLGELREARAERPVTLTASVGFTGLWLLPRLKHFHQRWPGLDLRVSAHNKVLDLRVEGIDLAIRYTSPDRVPPGSTRLFGHAIAPVAHPSLGIGHVASADDLSAHSLLEYDDPTYPWLRWSDWLASAGWRDARPRRMQHFNQYDQVIQAAVDGQGIALGRLELMRDLLRDGRLAQVGSARPSEVSDHAYWLVRQEDDPRPDVGLVADWLEAEARDGEG